MVIREAVRYGEGYLYTEDERLKQGKCVTLFNVEDATYIEGEMEVYEYQQDGGRFVKKY
jgi:hypothetical protein